MPYPSHSLHLTLSRLCSQMPDPSHSFSSLALLYWHSRNISGPPLSRIGLRRGGRAPEDSGEHYCKRLKGEREGRCGGPMYRGEYQYQYNDMIEKKKIPCTISSVRGCARRCLTHPLPCTCFFGCARRCPPNYLYSLLWRRLCS